MAKLKLDLQELRVESFAAQEVDGALQGTVRARELTLDVSCTCPVTDLAHTCTCPDSSVKNACFCTEWQSCWCEDA